MNSLAITGSGGFFGWHLRARLRALQQHVDVRLIDRTTWDDEGSLRAALDGVDAVAHLAGANRGPDDDVYGTNIALAERLVEALEPLGSAPHLVFANSTHADGDTAYGRSKRESAGVLAAWARRRGASMADLKFPNLFGECGRPHYNSAVATFCDDLAFGRPSSVNPEGGTELLHVQDACGAVLAAMEEGTSGSRRLEGTRMSIPEVYERLRRLRDEYCGAALPKLRDRIDLQLFNALRTAMFPTHYPMPLTAHRDPRGVFAEVARGHGETQTSFSTTAPGITRGEHYHFDKIERFVVIRGRAVIKLRRLFYDEVVAFDVDGSLPVVVDMPPLFVHNITNVGDGELLTLFWANDHFDPAAPDTFPEQVDATPAGATR